MRAAWPVPSWRRDNGPSRAGGRIGGVNTAICLLATIACLASIYVLTIEADVVRSQNALGATTGTLARGERVAIDGTPIDRARPARALVHAALERTIEAGLLRPSTERRVMLDDAIRAIDVALAARPRWGEASTVGAYARSLLDGRSAPGAQAAFARSYADGPYLSGAARWRIGFGVATWPLLSPATRARLIDEAVWHARLAGANRAQVFAVFRGSSAYEPFILRWREVRSLDADLAASGTGR